MRCSHCGKETGSADTRCPFCGFDLVSDDVPSSQTSQQNDVYYSSRRTPDRKKSRRRSRKTSRGPVILLILLTAILGLTLLGTGGYFLGQRIGLFESPDPKAAQTQPVSEPTPNEVPSPSPTPLLNTPSPAPAETVQPVISESPLLLQGSDQWPLQYQNYIQQKLYLNQTDHPYYTTESSGIRFALYDLDGNKTPELLAYNGSDQPDEAAVYILTCEGGSILYLGNTSGSDPEFYGYESNEYPGIFCTDASGDVFTTRYICLKNGTVFEETVLQDDYSGILEEDAEIQSTQVTEDDALFTLVSESPATDRSYLTFYSQEDILEMGWSGFVTLSGWGE